MCPRKWAKHPRSALSAARMRARRLGSGAPGSARADLLFHGVDIDVPPLLWAATTHDPCRAAVDKHLFLPGCVAEDF